MHNYRKLFFIAVLVLFTVKAEGGVFGTFIDVAQKVVSKVGDAANFLIDYGGAQRSATILNRVMPENLKMAQEVTSAMPENLNGIKDSLDNINGTVGTLKDGVETVGKSINNLEKIHTIIGGIAAVASIYTIVKDTYAFGRFTKSFVWPSEEELLRKRKISQELQVLKTEERIYGCLVRNVLGEKQEDGLPSACKVEAEQYAQAAGYRKLNKLATEFRKR